jgi:hypothetical protein
MILKFVLTDFSFTEQRKSVSQRCISWNVRLVSGDELERLWKESIAA